MVRVNAATSVAVLNLDDRITQLQSDAGHAASVRVRRLRPTRCSRSTHPTSLFTLRRPGEYRIDVDRDSDATTIVMRTGQGEAHWRQRRRT